MSSSTGNYNTHAKAGRAAQISEQGTPGTPGTPRAYSKWLDNAATTRAHAYKTDTTPYARETSDLKPSDRQKEYYEKPVWSYNPPGTTGAASQISLADNIHCNTTGSKDAKLRDILMVQLLAMAQSATTGDEGCGFACGEDAELDKMQTLYKQFNGDMGTGTGMCSIGDFENNPRIVVLKAQKSVLEFMTFSFLHQTCEGTHDCNPYESMMPKELLNCCGLYEGAPLFYDGDLQAVGSYLAGAQGSPKGLTPAANGHCANFYMSGTIAPGRDKQLYVNVCYVGNAGDRGVIESQDGSGAGVPAKPINIGMKWVKANRMERAKFDALREIEAKMVAQKRSVLQVNHKMLQLQQSLVGLNPYANGGGGAGGGGAASNDEFLTKKLRAVVESSTRRVRNEMGRRFGQMEDEHRLALPQLMSPSGRAGSELRAIDRLRRNSRGRGNSRSRSRRAAASAAAAARAADAASDDASDDDDA